MALLTFAPPPAKGSTSTATLDKVALFALVPEGDYFKTEANVAKCKIKYKSSIGSQQKSLTFDLSPTSSLTTTINFSAKARDVFEIVSIILFDYDGGSYIVPSSSIPSGLGIDITPALAIITYSLQNYPDFATLSGDSEHYPATEDITSTRVASDNTYVYYAVAPKTAFISTYPRLLFKQDSLGVTTLVGPLPANTTQISDFYVTSTGAMYAANGGSSPSLYYSANAGQSWSNMSPTFPGYVEGFQFANDVLYVQSEGLHKYDQISNTFSLFYSISPGENAYLLGSKGNNLFIKISSLFSVNSFNVSSDGAIGAPTNAPTGTYKVATSGTEFLQFNNDGSNANVSLFNTTDGSVSDVQQLSGVNLQALSATGVYVAKVQDRSDNDTNKVMRFALV